MKVENKNHLGEKTNLSELVTKRDYDSHHQLPLAIVQYLRESWSHSPVGDALTFDTLFQPIILMKTEHWRRIEVFNISTVCI